MVVLCSSPRPAREAAAWHVGGFPRQQVPLLPAQLCCTGSSLTWRRQRAGVGVSSGSRRPRRGLVSEYKLKLSFLDTFWQPLVLPPVEVIFGQKSFSPPSPGAGDAEHARRGLVGQLALLGENSRSKVEETLTAKPVALE